jgi:hypothetical protein
MTIRLKLCFVKIVDIYWLVSSLLCTYLEYKDVCDICIDSLRLHGIPFDYYIQHGLKWCFVIIV